jgi:hypothetical protein
MASIHEHATTQMLGSGIDRLSGRQLRHAVTGYFARYRFACFSSWVLWNALIPMEHVARPSVVVNIVPGLSWGQST